MLARKSFICHKFQQCTEVRFASFFSGGFITAIVVNPPEKRLTKCTSVQWVGGGGGWGNTFRVLSGGYWLCPKAL
jgi:hypothetical protein